MGFPWITSRLDKDLLLGSAEDKLESSRQWALSLPSLFSREKKKKKVSGRYLQKGEAMWQEMQTKPMDELALKLPKQGFS